MSTPGPSRRSMRTQDIGRPPVRERKVTPPRIRRRRLLFWLSVVPALIVFLYGVHFARLGAVFDRAMGEYTAGDYYDSYREFRDMRSPNVVDPWKAHFNAGTAAYRADSLFAAQRALETALEIVPEEHRCDVQTNLSFVYEAYGDLFDANAQEEYAWAVAQAEAEIARENGEPYDASLFELDYNDEEVTSAQRFDYAAFDFRMAADYYSLAADAINDPACQTPPEPDASEEEQEQAEQEQEQREAEQDRLEEQALEAEQQRQETERAAAGEDPSEAEPEPEGETEEERAAREEAERQQEIEQRNQDAQEEASGGEGDGGDSDTPGTDPGAPPLSNW